MIVPLYSVDLTFVLISGVHKLQVMDLFYKCKIFLWIIRYFIGINHEKQVIITYQSWLSKKIFIVHPLDKTDSCMSYFMSPAH